MTSTVCELSSVVHGWVIHSDDGFSLNKASKWQPVHSKSPRKSWAKSVGQGWNNDMARDLTAHGELNPSIRSMNLRKDRRLPVLPSSGLSRKSRGLEALAAPLVFT